MKTLIKITKRLFVILLFLSLTNCERDKIHSETEQQGVKRIHRISIADFNSKVAKNKKYNKLQSYFDTYVSNKNDSNSKIEQGDDVTIQTDEVLLIQTDSIDYYTFKLLTDNTDNTFYNLVVNVNDQDEIAKSVIFEYNPSDNWLQDTTQAYSGYVSVADNDIISLEDLFTAKFGDECIIGSTSYWICNENVLGHYEGHPSCDQATAWENVVTPIYAPCDELTSGNYYIAGDEENADGGGPTNGGTGNPPNDNDPINDEEDASPTIPTPADYAAPIVSCINGLGQTDGVTLTQDMVDWLNANNDLLKPYGQFLNENNCSVVSQQEIFEMLELIVLMDKKCQAMALFKSVYRVNSTFTNTMKDYFILGSNHLFLADLAVGEGNPSMLNNVGARTRPDLATDALTGDQGVLIEFNDNHLDNATELGFISTFYHELVHAYLLHLYHNDNLLDEYPQYTILKNSMDNFFNDPNNIELSEIYVEEMHNIYVDFIDLLAESIVNYCNENNISGVDTIYAKKLVWGGLNGNTIFNETLTTQEQLEAQTLLGYENSNITSNAKGTKKCN